MSCCADHWAEADIAIAAQALQYWTDDKLPATFHRVRVPRPDEPRVRCLCKGLVSSTEPVSGQLSTAALCFSACSQIQHKACQGGQLLTGQGAVQTERMSLAYFANARAETIFQVSPLLVQACTWSLWSELHCYPAQGPEKKWPPMTFKQASS